MKAVIFLGDSRDAIRGFGKAASHEIGAELMLLQLGREPMDSKPMRAVGAGVREIRVSVEGEYRVLYVVRRNDAVYVLHAFRKKSQRTAREDIDKAARRFRSI